MPDPSPHDKLERMYIELVHELDALLDQKTEVTAERDQELTDLRRINEVKQEKRQASLTELTRLMEDEAAEFKVRFAEFKSDYSSRLSDICTQIAGVRAHLAAINKHKRKD